MKKLFLSLLGIALSIISLLAYFNLNLNPIIIALICVICVIYAIIIKTNKSFLKNLFETIIGFAVTLLISLLITYFTQGTIGNSQIVLNCIIISCFIQPSLYLLFAISDIATILGF